MRRLARSAAVPALAAAAALVAGGAAGQRGPWDREAGLSELALLWAVGRYQEPVVCQVEQGPTRVARNLRIRPDPRSTHRPRDVLEIASLEVDGARCFNELGEDEPEIVGSLHLTHTGRHRPDTARKDFQQALRRDGGFEFEVPRGRLRVEDGPDGALRELDLAGGTLRLEPVAPGSDAARILGDVGNLPKRTLTLEAPDGTRLVFHAVLVRPR